MRLSIKYLVLIALCEGVLATILLSHSFTKVNGHKAPSTGCKSMVVTSSPIDTHTITKPAIVSKPLQPAASVPLYKTAQQRTVRPVTRYTVHRTRSPRMAVVKPGGTHMNVPPFDPHGKGVRYVLSEALQGVRAEPIAGEPALTTTIQHEGTLPGEEPVAHPGSTASSRITADVCPKDVVVTVLPLTPAQKGTLNRVEIGGRAEITAQSIEKQIGVTLNQIRSHAMVGMTSAQSATQNTTSSTRVAAITSPYPTLQIEGTQNRETVQGKGLDISMAPVNMSILRTEKPTPRVAVEYTPTGLGSAMAVPEGKHMAAPLPAAGNGATDFQHQSDKDDIEEKTIAEEPKNDETELHDEELQSVEVNLHLNDGTSSSPQGTSTLVSHTMDSDGTQSISTIREIQNTLHSIPNGSAPK